MNELDQVSIGGGGVPLDEDTIVAVSTPPGRGGIGIVRLSGAAGKSIVEGLVSLTKPLDPGRVRFGRVIDTNSGRVLDEAVVTYFAAPHSYTAEDVVEIAAHGSPAVMEYLLQACCARGARLAEAGEFTQRAFLRGRIDLTQAEAVDDLIQSQTLEQARVAARQLGGSLSQTVKPVKEKLVELIAALEAGIDFAEDDIDVMPGNAIATVVKEIVEPLEALTRSFAYGRVVREGFSLAIVGRPNAGKSSLFNRLVQRERAIVTAKPGTTRDLVTETVSLEGIPVELIDTAGLRSAAEVDEAEELGMAKSREAMAEAGVVLVVVDASMASATSDTDNLRAELSGRSAIVVRNKCDLVEVRSGDGIWVSALTGEGIAELRKAIVKLVTRGGSSSGDGMLTNVRQQQAVTAAITAMTRAGKAVSERIPHEMVLLDFYEALQALDGLTGVTTSDDVLRLIFSRFCIGK